MLYNKPREFSTEVLREVRSTDLDSDNGGELRINVFNESIAEPIDGANIQIIDPETNEVLYKLTTDSSGMTKVVLLEAPPVELTLSPDAAIKPYKEYTVSVSRPGFSDSLIEGVEIISTETSNQNVMLHEGTSHERDIIKILPHSLWADYPEKIPESPIKPINEGTGFVVLDRTVIPEFIVVKEGIPTGPGPIRYIPFTDYIKNVASSEIFPTWSRATIEANVLAIISFTLNRVFTEWYRGQGHYFTITSSTAFDQFFVFGRNIFSQISEVVDYIFTNYVTRPNIIQPLLTQYCDGRRSQCPNWLSQWGSEILGSQGYSAIEILRRFYGPEIYLDQAEKVTGVPISFPGYNLERGSRGPSVTRIQSQLNAIRNNFPAIPQTIEDGIFGPVTEEAVRKFQDIFMQASYGIVDYPTWYRIANIYVAVTRMAELK